MAETQPAQKYLACIRALTDQCATLIWEQEELQKQVWRYEKNGVTCQTYGHKIDSSCSECNVHENYTTPPKREWVDLTDADADDLFVETQRHMIGVGSKEFTRIFTRLINAKLKEKNT